MSNPLHFGRRLCACILAVSAVLLAFVPASAQAQPKGRPAPAVAAGAGADKGELWETTVSMSMAGFSMPAQTHSVCLGKNATDEDKIPKSDNCRVTESRRVGNTHRFKMTCTGREPMTAEGEFTYTADGYEGRMKMVSRDGEMNQTISARKRGECTGTIQAQARAMQAQAKEAEAQAAAQTAEVCARGIAELTPELFFQPGALCADRREAFCGEVRGLGESMRTASGYAAARARGRNLKAAYASCELDLAPVTLAACKDGVASGNWRFVGSGNCDDDVRAAGPRYCNTGPSRSPDPQYFALCSRYVSLTRGTAEADAAPATNAPAAAAPKAPVGDIGSSTQDAVNKGINALRKLLPF